MKPLVELLGGLTLFILLVAGLRTTPVHAICAPLPALETAVADTNLIVIGTATALVIEPPLDPNTPDALTHMPHFTVAVDEYIKGSGPNTITMREDGFSYSFDSNGNVVIQNLSIQFFAEDAVGKRYLLFLPSANPLNSPACTWSRQLGFPTAGIGDNELIQRIRAILQATPTPIPSSAPTAAPTEVPTASSTPIPPVGLPPTGSNGEGDRPAIEIAIAAGLGTLVLGGGFVWRIHNQRRV